MVVQDGELPGYMAPEFNDDWAYQDEGDDGEMEEEMDAAKVGGRERSRAGSGFPFLMNYSSPRRTSDVLRWPSEVLGMMEQAI